MGWFARGGVSLSIGPQRSPLPSRASDRLYVSQRLIFVRQGHAEGILSKSRKSLTCFFGLLAGLDREENNTR